VRVRQFFEANGTAYLVMDYYEGISLAEHLESLDENGGGRLPEETAKQLLLSILDGLRAVHAKGFLHRDVKPQNIYLARTDTSGVRPILLDFGAARQAMGERSRSLSVMVSAGYAPFEQYHRKGSHGPWTDIYAAAAAVLYRTVTGETPPEATEPISADELKPASAFGASKGLSDALSAALAIATEARPQSVREFQARLWGSRPPPATPLSPAPTTHDAQPQHAAASSDPSPPKRGRRWWLAPAVLVPLLVPLVGAWGQLESRPVSRWRLG
jgi:serine/threonine protein kinase